MRMEGWPRVSLMRSAVELTAKGSVTSQAKKVMFASKFFVSECWSLLPICYGMEIGR
jgi:hypothetical protein